MKQFNAEAARQAGYSDAEIATFLAGEQKFDLDGARGAGYSDAEIVQQLAKPRVKTGAPKFDLLGEMGRQIGLTTRHAVTGLTAIPNMIGDAVGLGSSQAVSDTLTRLGLPEPTTATERVVGDVTGAMAGGGGLIGLGGKMTQAASPVVQRVGGMFAAAPGGQTVANTSGAAAAGATRESGGSETQQMLAALMGSTLPGAAPYGAKAAIRGAVRGGDRTIINDNLRLLMETGTPPTVGLATGNRRTQAMESVLSRSPGGAGRMADTAENIATSLGNRVHGIADDLSPNADPTLAGMAIERGIKNFVEGFQARQEQLYGVLDNYVAQDAPVSVATSQRALADLSSDIKGATAVSEILRNPKIRAIADAFKADAGTGTLPYSAIKELRTEVGKVVAESPLVSGAPVNQWKRLYGALTSDMEAAAKAAGPEAERAFSRANAYTKAGMQRIDDHLERAIRPTAEQTYRTLVSDPGNASKIAATLKSLSVDDRNVVKAAFIDRLGKATAGRQDLSGEVFSTETFLSSWSKLDPRSKAVLFSGQDGQLRADLDKIAKVADQIRKGSKVFSNPSGTSAGVASMAPLTAGALALTGNVGAAGSILAAMGAANVSARLMTAPWFVRFLARSTAMPQSSVPALLNSMSQAASAEADSALQADVSEVVRQLQR